MRRPRRCKRTRRQSTRSPRGLRCGPPGRRGPPCPCRGRVGGEQREADIIGTSFQLYIAARASGCTHRRRRATTITAQFLVGILQSQQNSLRRPQSQHTSLSAHDRTNDSTHRVHAPRGALLIIHLQEGDGGDGGGAPQDRLAVTAGAQHQLVVEGVVCHAPHPARGHGSMNHTHTHTNIYAMPKCRYQTSHDQRNQ